MKKMKKVLAGLLAATMVMSMSVTAFAKSANYEKNKDFIDEATVTVAKTYNATNTGTTSPQETFTFSELTCTKVTDAAKGVTINNAPVPTIGSVSYDAGGAGSNSKTKDITITLPDYNSVGIYTYTFHENDDGTAGVTYNTKEIELVVTVIEQNRKVRVAAVHTEDLDGDKNAASPSNAKTDGFDNEYSAGSLAVKKNVTGLLGDQQKEFTVKVTFTAPEGDTVRGDITYVDGTETKTIYAREGWTGSKEVEITLKHNETVTFNNIPYGVTYTVVENDYTTNDGYDVASYEFDDNNKKIDTASETVTITNNKKGDVDTGIILDSAPYILLLALAAMGVFAVVNKKREEEF